jgi:hypothetical protein
MEQCFILATIIGLSGVFPASLLRVESYHLSNTAARAPLNLLTERGNSTRAFIPGDALHAPKWKEQIAKSNKFLLMDQRPQPIVKGIQVEAAQEYSRRADVAENAPGLFTRTVKNNKNGCSSLDSGADVISFFQSLRLSLASNHS